MIPIDNCIISDELLQVCFACDLKKCKGACCVEGDAGAPLEEDEISVLEDCLEKIKPYMIPEGVEVVESIGVFDYDMDGNYATPLINNRECAFICFDGDIAFCAIEKAWLDKKIKFQKPISCHLYPIRIQKYDGFEAVNYHRWSICDKALVNGKRNNIPVYKFLREPLIRKYGKKWYQQLEAEFKGKEE
jgi:hypothetical protein